MATKPMLFDVLLINNFYVVNLMGQNTPEAERNETRGVIGISQLQWLCLQTADSLQLHQKLIGQVQITCQIYNCLSPKCPGRQNGAMNLS